MLDKLDYSLVPNDFALCFNGKCLHASTCLRHQVSRHIPKERWAVRAINPERVVPDGDCSGFMDDSPLKNAYGMEHLLDNIPYRQAKEIRREMREYFGTTHFYRLKRKERCFTPEDQYTYAICSVNTISKRNPSSTGMKKISVGNVVLIPLHEREISIA